VSGKDKADDAVRFFERRLTHTKGSFSKKPFILSGWERKIVRDIFGTVKSNGMRRYTTAYVEIPKKNGKSELGAGIALAGLLLDEESGAEVYSAASTRDQATIVFRIAAQMVRNDPTLSSMCRIVDSTKTIYLRDEPSSFYKAISADAGIQDGINPHVVVFDELHRQKNRDLWDVFRYGSPTRDQPLLFAITTAGIIGESPICEEQHDYARRLLDGTFKDSTYYPVIYGLGEKDDWTFEGEPAKNGKPATGWYKVNPALGDYLPIERIRAEYRSALEMPTQQNSFRRFRLGQWVGQETRFIPMEFWRACGDAFNVQDLAGLPCWGGLDMSTTRDLTAFVLVFPKDGKYYLVSYFFIPGDDLSGRSRKDNVPYDLWAAQGLVHVTPGNQVDYSFVRKTINDLSKLYDIREIGFDRWNATQIVQQLMDDGLTMVPIGQGYQSMNAPTAELLAMVSGGRLQHGGHPVLSWMADCMTVKQDPAGNVKPSKPDRMKSKKRIDGIAATIDALARVIVDPGLTKSIYEDRGIIILGGA
jgi:phage terminase large subunit-like protein